MKNMTYENKSKISLLSFSKIILLSDPWEEVIKAHKLHAPFSGCRTAGNVQGFDCSDK